MTNNLKQYERYPVWTIINRYIGRKNISQKFGAGCTAAGSPSVDVDVETFMTARDVIRPLTDIFIPDEGMMPNEKHDFILYGVLNGMAPIYRWCKKVDNPFYYIDHSYFNRGHENLNYKITKNEPQPTTVKDWPDDRWKKLDQTIHPWKKNEGGDIIVCPPSNHMVNFWELGDWLEETVATLKEHTDRNIIVRKKPKIKKGLPFEPLIDALQHTYAVVTFNSNVTTEAIQHGVPVFTHPMCAASCVGETDFTKIEEPVYPEREKWFHHLAYSQFHISEMMGGGAWCILQETEQRESLWLK